MNWAAGSVQILIDGKMLDGRCWGPAPDQAPTIVLLHEGLGSVGLWKDFPAKLSLQTGYGVFAFSRAGYGQSDLAGTPRPLDFMQHEAKVVLPLILDLIGCKRGILVGHSDGASIAAIFLGHMVDSRICAACRIAPHFFTEAPGLKSIRAAKQAFEVGPLRDQLARHHRNPEHTFYGWNDVWLDPGFEGWNIEDVIPKIRVPVLAIQGQDDQYGTLAQIDALCKAMAPTPQVRVLADCTHSPHIEKPAELIFEIGKFAARFVDTNGQ